MGWYQDQHGDAEDEMKAYYDTNLAPRAHRNPANDHYVKGTRKCSRCLQLKTAKDFNLEEKAKAANRRVCNACGPPLPKDVRTLKVDALRDELTKRGLATDGKKDDLVERLEHALYGSEEEEEERTVQFVLDGPRGTGRNVEYKVKFVDSATACWSLGSDLPAAVLAAFKARKAEKAAAEKAEKAAERTASRAATTATEGPAVVATGKHPCSYCCGLRADVPHKNKTACPLRKGDMAELGYTQQTASDYERYNLGTRDAKAKAAHATHQQMLTRANQRYTEAEEKGLAGPAAEKAFAVAAAAAARAATAAATTAAAAAATAAAAAAATAAEAEAEAEARAEDWRARASFSRAPAAVPSAPAAASAEVKPASVAVAPSATVHAPTMSYPLVPPAPALAAPALAAPPLTIQTTSAPAVGSGGATACSLEREALVRQITASAAAVAAGTAWAHARALQPHRGSNAPAAPLNPHKRKAEETMAVEAPAARLQALGPLGLAVACPWPQCKGRTFKRADDHKTHCGAKHGGLLAPSGMPSVALAEHKRKEAAPQAAARQAAAVGLAAPEAAVVRPPPLSAGPPPLPEGWVEAKDARYNKNHVDGETYWYHRVTEETSWARPVGDCALHL